MTQNTNEGEDFENDPAYKEAIESNRKIEEALQPVIELLLQEKWEESLNLLDKLFEQKPDLRCHRSLQMRYLALFWLRRFEEGAKDAFEADDLNYDPLAYLDGIILKFHAKHFRKPNDFLLERNIRILANELCDPEVFLVGALIFLDNGEYQKLCDYLNQYESYQKSQNIDDNSYVYYVLRIIQNLLLEKSFTIARSTFEDYKQKWADSGVEKFIESWDKYLNELEANPDNVLQGLLRLKVIGPPLREGDMGSYIYALIPKVSGE